MRRTRPCARRADPCSSEPGRRHVHRPRPRWLWYPPGKYRIVIVLKMKRDAVRENTKETPFDRDTDMLKDRFSPERLADYPELDVFVRPDDRPR